MDKVVELTKELQRVMYSTTYLFEIDTEDVVFGFKKTLKLYRLSRAGRLVSRKHYFEAVYGIREVVAEISVVYYCLVEIKLFAGAEVVVLRLVFRIYPLVLVGPAPVGKHLGRMEAKLFGFSVGIYVVRLIFRARVFRAYRDAAFGTYNVLYKECVC